MISGPLIRKELGVTFIGHRSCQPRLSGTWRTMQQHTAWRIDTEASEQLRITEWQFNHLAQLIDGFVQPANIIIGHIRPSMLGRFLIFGPQFNFGILVNMHKTLGCGRHNGKPNLLQRKGRRSEHLPQLRRHVTAIHLLLAMRRDKITGIQWPSHEAALETIAAAMQTQVFLSRSEDHFFGWLRINLADFHKIAGPHSGIGTLQPVQPDKIQSFIFRIGQYCPCGGRLLSANFDHFAFNQTQGRHIVSRQAGQTAPTVFRSGIGDLEPKHVRVLVVVLLFVRGVRIVRHRAILLPLTYYQLDRVDAANMRLSISQSQRWSCDFDTGQAKKTKKKGQPRRTGLKSF